MDQNEIVSQITKMGVQSRDINAGHGTVIVTVRLRGRFITPQAVRELLKAEGFNRESSIEGEEWHKTFQPMTEKDMLNW